MHEWAISQNLLNHALAKASEEGASRIRSITVEVGELGQIDLDILRFALGQLKKGTMAESAAIEVTRTEARFSCRRCGHEWAFSETRKQLISEMGQDNPVHYVPDFIYSFMHCPRCDSPDFDITSGRDIRISMEGER